LKNLSRIFAIVSTKRRDISKRIHFSGKFFCIPHSTENSLEKYRYRRKADEIRDAELRQKELIHRTTNDWKGTSTSNYFDSISPRHKERLISSIDANHRGTTPER
jgi:hypothetical protein